MRIADHYVCLQYSIRDANSMRDVTLDWDWPSFNTLLEMQYLRSATTPRETVFQYSIRDARRPGGPCLRSRETPPTFNTLLEMLRLLCGHYYRVLHLFQYSIRDATATIEEALRRYLSDFQYSIRDAVLYIAAWIAGLGYVFLSILY